MLKPVLELLCRQCFGQGLRIYKRFMLDHAELFLNSHGHHMRSLFGIYAKRKREELALTKTAVAAGLGVSLKKYSSLENGEAFFSEDLFKKMIFFLHLDKTEIFELFQVAQVRWINEVAEAFYEEFPS